MGLPEYFAGGSLGLERQIGVRERAGDATSRRGSFTRELLGAYEDYSPLVMVVSDRPRLAPRAPSARTSLGHQFLFGLFPVTYLFLQHDSSSLVGELLLDSLQERGFTPLVVSPEDLDQARKAFAPDLILTPKLSSLSVNAYDAFFFRVISIQGALELSLKDRGDSPEQQRRDVSLREYRSHAHAPLLSTLLERALREALRSIVHALPQKHATRALSSVVVTPSGPGPLLLEEPRFAEPPPVGIGMELAAAYGFDFTPPFTFSSVLRLIQRGIEDGVAQQGLASVSLRGEWSPAAARDGDWWRLQAQIATIELQARESETGAAAIRLRAHFSLKTRAGVLLSQAECERIEPLAEHVDGALVVTLEHAAAVLSQAFLQESSADRGAQGKSLCAFKSDSLRSLGERSAH